MMAEEAKQHIEQIRKGKLEKDSPDLRAALAILAEELNARDSHFILELLQNAEDNEYDGKEPELCLCIESGNPTNTASAEGCLVVQNNEVGFQPEHVLRICSIGQSSKKKNADRDYIGEKGIGFKSVFRITDSPHIFSNGYQFCFRKPDGAELGYILPHWVEAAPPVTANGGTVILLPLKPGKKDLISEQLSKIAPECVLFLHKLKRLRLGDNRTIFRDGERLEVTLRCDGKDSLYFLYKDQVNKPEDIAEDKRPGILRREITIAFPLKTTAACTGRIFAFLPTELDTGLPFLINADFLLNLNREGVLEDRRWNQWLRDEIAPAFVKAFLAVLKEPDWRMDAYRFLPIASDLTPHDNFFAPIVKSVQNLLKSKECILTQAEKLVLPERAHFAGPLASKILRDCPPDRANISLLHPSLERHLERLKVLGVQSLKFDQLFGACNDDEWLKSRDAEWWHTLFELCTKCDVSSETIGSFPILPCRDGNCRPISSGVFYDSEKQPVPKGIPAGWPAAHLLDANLQIHLQQKPAAWTWLTRVASLRPLSIQSYVTSHLLGWVQGKSGAQLIEATRYISNNLEYLDTQARQSVGEKLPWLLADGQVLSREKRSGKELVTPECLEGAIGWNLLFCALDRHFFIIRDDYCVGLSDKPLENLREVFKAGGATPFPDPLLRELNPGEAHYSEVLARCAPEVYGTPRLRDWAAPGWLLGLEKVGQATSVKHKVAALERWLTHLGPEYAKKFLHCSKPDHRGNWQQIGSWSEFRNVLHKKYWMRTSLGYAAPPDAYLDTPEFREFFGDSVAYVVADLLPLSPFLEILGTRTHLTTDVLIALLRQMSQPPVPINFGLLEKVYRRLQDCDFDVGLFRREHLIFLAEPKPRWLSTEKLVWEDAGELFDEDFGYASLTYGKSELHRFFTEKLKIPLQPELRHYAAAWKSLSSNAAPDGTVVEKKLKVVLQRLADFQNELTDCDWWTEIKPHLGVWTDRREFQSPQRVYAPDHSVAVEVFTGRVNVAFPSKPNRTVMGFLRWIGCPSLARAVETKLVETTGEFMRPNAACLNDAAKELCVLLVCSHAGWRDRCSLLQALLETSEVGVTAITVAYSLRDNTGAGIQNQSRDAYWDVAKRRLLLREGVDAETLRDAAAKSIAGEFFGEAASTEMNAAFFLLLTVTVERARKLRDDQTTWRLTPEQQDWLREQNWKIVITELDEVEKPPLPRGSTAPPPPVSNSSAGGKSEPQASGNESPGVQGAGGASKGADSSVSSRKQTETTGTNKEAGKQTDGSMSEPEREVPADLHEVNSTTAKFVEVRAHTRSSPQRARAEQTSVSRDEKGSGLASVSKESKAALEERGREFAAKMLNEMGYETEIMGIQNPGFDVRGKKPGHLLKVEVKSHAREANSVFMTQRECDEYLTTLGVSGETWELWNIENLAKASGKTPTIQRIGHIPESARKESGYWVDLGQCSQEPSACSNS